jgi:hypothetical protein
MTASIKQIEEACSEERLLERAVCDCAEAFARYACSTNGTTRGAIRWLNGLRASLEETQARIQAERARQRA